MAASWFVVPNLDEAVDQLNKRFPKRDKRSDGSIGDQSHSTNTSSHNPDKTGRPEWRDGDSKNEVRARDIDKDLKDPDYSMENVVQLWVKAARASDPAKKTGLWWVRYIIFNGRIWHRKDGFKTRQYTGKNKHTEHAHVTSDFTKSADEARGTDWRLGQLKPKDDGQGGGDTPPKPPTKPSPIPVNGKLDSTTIRRWQQIMKTPVDGKIDRKDSELIRRVQVVLHRVDHRIKVDGDLGPKTIAALQRYLKSPVDGVISKPVSEMVKALQRRLNTGKF